MDSDNEGAEFEDTKQEKKEVRQMGRGVKRKRKTQLKEGSLMNSEATLLPSPSPTPVTVAM